MAVMEFVKSQGLWARCVRGVAVLASGSVAERGARLLRNIVLTRLLAPEQFGLMALVLAANHLFEAMTEVGVRQAVVQNKRGASVEYLNVAWWFSAIRGLGLCLLGWMAAPWLAAFYEEPGLTQMLRVAFLSMLFNGLTSPGLFVLEKQLRFGWVVLITQGAGLLGTILSLILAVYYPNVWSLVIGFVAEAAFCCIGSFLVCPIKPKLRFDRQAAVELFKFSRGMVGLPILTYLFLQADIFVMGRLCSKDTLGYYSMALTLACMPDLLFSRTVGPLVLPVFSKMQEQKERLRENILRMTRGLYLFGLPTMVCLAVFAQPILSIIYGNNYAQVHWAYALLNIYMLFFTAGRPITFGYMAVGRPELHRSFTILRVVLMVIGIYPAVLWGGPTGAAVIRIVSLSLAGIWQLVNLRRLLDLPIRRYADTAMGGLLLAGTVGIPALAWRYWVDAPWLQLLGGMFLGGLAWIVGIWTLREKIKHRLFGSKAPVLVN